MKLRLQRCSFNGFLSAINLIYLISIFHINECLKYLLQQGKASEAEKAIKTLCGKERVAEVMNDFATAGQGSTEPEAGWFDLFSSRYWKGISENYGDKMSFNLQLDLSTL